MTIEALKGVEGMTSREAERSKNFFALGLMSWLYHRPIEGTLGFMTGSSGSGPRSPTRTRTPSSAGWNYGETSEDFASSYEVAPAKLAPARTVRSPGNTALTYGLIAASKLSGLPLFLGAYPITPASDVLEQLAQLKHFGVRTFQAEDEIAASGAALGAAFGGALGVTTSAGPGIVLKSQTVGLAVTLELPLSSSTSSVPAVDRHADDAGAADMLWSCSGGTRSRPSGRRRLDALGVLRRGDRGRAHRHRVPDAGLPALGRIPANGSEPWLIPDVDGLPDIST